MSSTNRSSALRTNGPSNVATTSAAASGSTPETAGCRALRASWAAARRRDHPGQVAGPEHQRHRPGQVQREGLGRVHERLRRRARSLGDRRPARSAVAARVAASPGTSPSASAATSTGTASAHRLVRDERCVVGTGTCTPRARAHTSASGDPSRPTVSSRQPRRAASVATASGPYARPDTDTATTRSSGLTQPGQRRGVHREHRHRAARAGQRGEQVADDRRAAERGRRRPRAAGRPRPRSGRPPPARAGAPTGPGRRRRPGPAGCRPGPRWPAGPRRRAAPRRRCGRGSTPLLVAERRRRCLCGPGVASSSSITGMPSVTGNVVAHRVHTSDVGSAR